MSLAAAEGGEVDEVDADVADRALAAVGGRQAPQPAVLGAPVAPMLADEPALQVGRLDSGGARRSRPSLTISRAR